ncbi:MAG: toll/interleukin-1 receptor domain-containing protein [Spirochaetota bacterium]
MSVFISYSHEDSKIVEKIAKYLVKENLHVWIDKWQLNFGDSLIQKVQDAISEASVLLIMLSKKSVESEWCKKELTAGLLRELEEKRVVTIPVLLEDCQIPLFLRDKYYADFRSDFQKAIRQLQDNLLRNTDINLNRVKVDKYLTDWSLDSGEKDGAFFLNIDSVSFSDEYEYSILCTLDVTGNRKASDLYFTSVSRKEDHIYVNEVINLLYTLDKNEDFRVLIKDNLPVWKYFSISDRTGTLEYKVRVYARRMGINNGFDILFDFGSIIRMVEEKRKEIIKK